MTRDKTRDTRAPNHLYADRNLSNPQKMVIWSNHPVENTTPTEAGLPPLIRCSWYTPTNKTRISFSVTGPSGYWIEGGTLVNFGSLEEYNKTKSSLGYQHALP
ncbi:hypothetical protein CDAR_253451 [Caerostris darwini]|uniref:Uncharacterized protein n=1 Tax=Caerostris darwini TaxID=1538125 RepID=A0AAV4MKV0_9ARAC|nr:hypothetical protein CDAR_253451 [Caerostris darwini]